MSQRAARPAVRALGPLLTLGGGLTLCACALDSAPAFTVLPGQGKDAAAFQQDDLVCRQHAATHTGFGDPGQPVAADAPAPEPAPPVATTPPPEDLDVDDTAYLQCMASRGDTVHPEPLAAAPPASLYSYPFTFFSAGLAFGGWHHGGWHHGGWQHGGSYHQGGSPHGWGGGHFGGAHAGGGRH